MTVASGLGDCIDNNTCAEYVNFPTPNAQTLAVAEQYDPNAAASYAAVQAAQAAVKAAVAPKTNNSTTTSVAPSTSTVQQQRNNLMQVSSVQPQPIDRRLPLRTNVATPSSSGSILPPPAPPAPAPTNTGTGTTSTAPSTSSTSSTTTTTNSTDNSTDNPFMDWLGLSSTPVTPLIAGVPNWVLLAGGLGLAAYLFSKE